MPPRITEVSQARNAIGQEVRVVGEAQRTKLAPSVSTGSFHIYCLGQEEWSPDRLGQQVVVTGRLDLTDEFQATGSVEEGTISQGTGGPVWVLRQCQIHDSGAE
jgi:hypothetical protein